MLTRRQFNQGLSSISSLTALTDLRLYDNPLSTDLVLANLTALQYLDLHNCSISGSVPSVSCRAPYFGTDCRVESRTINRVEVRRLEPKPTVQCCGTSGTEHGNRDAAAERQQAVRRWNDESSDVLLFPQGGSSLRA